MNILIANGFANRQGGADVYTENLAINLAKRGHNVNVLCHNASPSVSSTCHVTLVPKSNYKDWPLLWRFSPFLTELHWLKYLYMLTGPRPEVVINSLPLCEYALANRFPQVPRIYIPHSRIAPLEACRELKAGIFRNNTYRTYYNAERHAILNSFATVRFTSGLADTMIDYYKLPATCPFHIIPQAIDTSPVPYKLRTGIFRILSVGRLIPSKNISLIISSLRIAASSDWRLDILGDGPDCELLKSMVDTPELQSRITFHGHQDNPSNFYSKADLLAFPSKLENLSLVVLEAMAHGVPALVIRADNNTYFNAHHEIIQHGYNGFIADNSEHFTNLINACIDNPMITRNIAYNTLISASSYTWPMAMKEWDNLLSKSKIHCNM